MKKPLLKNLNHEKTLVLVFRGSYNSAAEYSNSYYSIKYGRFKGDTKI